MLIYKIEFKNEAKYLICFSALVSIINFSHSQNIYLSGTVNDFLKIENNSSNNLVFDSASVENLDSSRRDLLAKLKFCLEPQCITPYFKSFMLLKDHPPFDTTYSKFDPFLWKGDTVQVSPGSSIYLNVWHIHDLLDSLKDVNGVITLYSNGSISVIVTIYPRTLKLLKKPHSKEIKMLGPENYIYKIVNGRNHRITTRSNR